MVVVKLIGGHTGLSKLLKVKNGLALFSAVLTADLSENFPQVLFRVVRFSIRDAEITPVQAKLWTKENDWRGITLVDSSRGAMLFSSKEPEDMRAELMNELRLRRISQKLWYVETNNRRLAMLYHRLDKGFRVVLTPNLKRLLQRDGGSFVTGRQKVLNFAPQNILRRGLRRYRSLLVKQMIRSLRVTVERLFPVN